MNREDMREVLIHFGERLGYDNIEDTIEDFLSELEDEGVLTEFPSEE